MKVFYVFTYDRSKRNDNLNMYEVMANTKEKAGVGFGQKGFVDVFVLTRPMMIKLRRDLESF